MRISLFLLPGCLTLAAAQNSPLHPVHRFPMPESSLRITRSAVANQPFSVAGETGGFFGWQTGTFEAWIFPAKVLSDAIGWTVNYFFQRFCCIKSATIFIWVIICFEPTA